MSPSTGQTPRIRALRRLVPAFACVLGISGAPRTMAVEIELPELGDASSAAVSPAVERKLGDAWLRMFRGQVDTVRDPLLQDYLEHVIFDLAAHSQLSEAKLRVVIVDNPTINAFAVPGGVVGINNGLLLSAEHEDELASVLAHELAHLSQRHYARSVEEARRNTIPNALILLGSLVVAATAGSGNNPMAAVAAGQAAIQQQQLRFSRANEREADRIGMQTLVDAGYNPDGMPRMFSRMLDSLRYNTRRPPEFLLSHPVTESRVADSKNRARNLVRDGRVDSLDFGMMRARVRVGFDETPGFAVKRFRAEIEKDGGLLPANRYGLVLALTKANEFESARNELAPLLREHPDSIPVVLAAAELDLAAGRTGDALQRLARETSLNPGNHPLTMAMAKALLASGKAKESAALLAAHAREHGDDPQVWYELAETQGLAGQILDVHRSRAEYFILNGALDLAERQLGYALNIAEGDFHATAGIQARISEVRTMRQEMKDL